MDESWKTSLEFATEDGEDGRAYSRKKVLRPCGFYDWFNDLNLVSRSGLTLKHHITTRILPAPFTGNSQHLLALDCDSFECKNSATDFLASNAKISYVVFISSYNDTGSSNRYWVLCDYIKGYHEVSSLLRNIPGVDPLFVRFCEEKMIINLRAYPKHLCVPIKQQYLSHGVASNDFLDWVKNFENYWKSDEFKSIARIVVDKEKDRSMVAGIGSHFDKETYLYIQNLINKDFCDNIEIASKRESIMQCVNAVYGMEVE